MGRNVSRISILLVALMLFAFPSFLGQTLAFSTVQSPASSTTSSGPVFVWMFGYVGDTFWPQANQSITPQETIQLAANLSAAVGASNLRIVNPVDVEPGHNIQSAYISTIASYVASLKQYASVVYGRIDMTQFNTTATIYPEVSMYVNQLGLNGVFFDLAPILYQRIGQSAFNNIIQNLSSSFPGLNYVMNEAANSNDYITPLHGTTWGANTYVMPTVSSGSYTFSGVSLSKIAALNKIYPGRVLLHYDSNAQLKGDPMGVFADQTTSSEISAVTTLAEKGAHPSQTQYRYNFLYPVLGAWTYVGSEYQGTLYNSLTFGTYDRGTIYSLTSIMVKYEG
jgi:hypothetical protein